MHVSHLVLKLLLVDHIFSTTVCRYRMYFSCIVFVCDVFLREALIDYVGQQVVASSYILRGSCLHTISFLFSTRSQCCILLSICSWNYGFQIQIPRPHDCLLWPISLCVSRKAGHRSLQPGSLCVCVGRQNWDCISR